MQSTLGPDFNSTELSELLTEAVKSGRHIRVAGYAGSKPNSGITDYVVRPLAAGAYGDYLRASLAWIKNAAQTDALRPLYISTSDWRTAVAETVASWEKSLQPKPEVSRGRTWKEVAPLVRADAADSSYFQIGPFHRVSAVTHGAKAASVDHATPVTEAKNIIKRNSPLDNLIFELHVFRGKMTSISLEPTCEQKTPGVT